MAPGWSVVLAAVAASDFTGDLRPLLEKHCFACHAGETTKGGVDLAAASSARDVRRRGRTFGRAVAMLEARRMPPARAVEEGRVAPLGDDDRARLAGGLRHLLAHPEPGEELDPGRVTLRRLGRFEFDRTIRSLLGVAYDSAATFPADPVAHGFDDIGDAMTFAPMLIEKYDDAGREIVRRLLADDAAREALLAPALAAGGVLDARAARAIAAPLLERAFRRPPAEQEVAARMRLFAGEISAGRPATEALGTVVRSILLSPHFLFRVETGDPAREEGGVRPLTDFELATRLSYFLGSTLPDAELLDLARGGRLREPAMLAAQARRLLSASAARPLADRFAAQWLRFGEVLTVAVDIRRFNAFYGLALREPFYEETARLFEAIVREDRSVLELLDCDSTYLDERLARHYGIAGVGPGPMRRVELPDRRRGGLIGMGSVLTITSFPLRTSPVLRGKWVLETLLDDPPPPPPADVPALPKDDRQADKLSLRARLEMHRRDPACAGCHERMDPIGFALESYDAIGGWREQTDDGLPIDPHARLPDGSELAGAIAVKEYLLARKDDFLRTLTRRLLVFAVGRPMEFTDEPLVEEIVARAKGDGFRFSAFVDGVVTSRPFRYLSCD